MRKYLNLMSKKTKVKCVFVVLLAAVSSILATSWPVMLGDLYTNISSGEYNTLFQIAVPVITFALFYLTAECISIVRRVILDCIIATHEIEVREQSIGKLLRMPVAYYSGSLSGERTAQLNQGVAGLSQLIKIICNDIVSTVLIAVCTIIQVLLNAPGIMAIIMIAYLLATLIVSSLQIRSQNGIRENIIKKKTELDGQVCQSITNLELIRGMNAEKYESNRLHPLITGIGTTEKRHHKYMGCFDCCKQFIKVAFQVILIVVSVILIADGKMPAGTVITVCLLFQQLIKPIDEVYRFMDETASSTIKAKTLIEVSTSAADSIYDIVSTKQNMFSDEIVINDVMVTNPEKTLSIAWYEDIIIRSDERTALQGANGCGKTSLIRCLTRYYPSVQGTISLFGKEQGDYSHKELADVLYYTPQKSFFIAGTVRENLIYGLDRDISDEELIDALNNVHLTGWNHTDTVIRQNPKEALDFVLGEKTDELSGGMKQRLSLARAFLRHPKLFIFDEITANLDKAASEYVLSNMENYAKKIGAGIVYISHDKDVVQRCDKVIRLQNKLQKADESKKTA